MAVMVEEMEWVREGFRQLRLGLAWQRYAQLAARRPVVAAVRATPADWIRDRVLPALLQAEWLPGVREALEQYHKQDANRPHEEFVVESFDQVESSFRHALRHAMTGKAQDARPVTEVQQQLCRILYNCHNDKQSSTPPEPLPPLYFPADALARAWLDTACAVKNWCFLEPALEETVNDRLPQQVRSLTEECNKIQVELRDCLALNKRQQPKVLQNFLANPNDKSHRLLQESCQLLTQCQETLTSLGQEVLSDLSQERLRLVSRIRSLIEWSADWPPQLLVRLRTVLVEGHGLAELDGLLEQLRSTGEGAGAWEKRLRGLPNWPRPTQARAGLALLLLEALDRQECARPLPTNAWDAVRDCVRRLLGATNLTAELIRTVAEYDGARELVRTTGLETCSVEDEIHVLREAVIEVPRKPSRLEAALSALAQQTAVTEPALAGLCRDAAEALRRQGGTVAWYADVDGQTTVWRILQRATTLAALEPGHQSAVNHLLLEFKEIGFTPTLLPRPVGFGDGDVGPWMLVEDRRVRGAVPLPTTTADGQAFGLRLPDGKVLAPTVWLCIPETWAGRRPLIRCLAESEPLIAGLKALDPGWKCWGNYNRALWELVYGAPRADVDPAEEVRVLKKVLILLRVRMKSKDKEGVGFRELARRLYHCVTEEMGVRLTPELDKLTFQPLPQKTPPDDGTRVVWEVSSKPFGEVLKIRNFGSPGSPGEIHVSGGPELPAEISSWLELPEPSFGKLVSSPHQLPSHPLTAWYQELPRLPWEPKRIGTALATHREAFRKWIGTREGAAWFNRFVQDLRQEPALEGIEQGRAWLALLGKQHWCACVPAVDFTTGAVTWPIDLTTAAPGIRWEFSDTVPARQALAGLVAFAPNAARAQGTFSLGCRQSGSALDLAYRMGEATNQLRDQALTGPVEALLQSTRAHALAGTAIDRPETLALSLLDTLASAGSLSAPAAGQREFLSLFRAWCITWGLEILPQGWTPGAAPPEEFGPSENESQPTRFGDGPPGTTRLVGLGLCAGAHIFRPCITLRCAGPAPPHYSELGDRLAALIGPDVTELRTALAEWPVAALEDCLPYKIIDFFAAFWKILGQEYRDQHLEPFERLETLVNELLERQLNLSLFIPEKLQNQSIDWVTLHGQGGVKTGRVRRVLQPGLMNSDGSIRVRAIVEVE